MSEFNRILCNAIALATMFVGAPALAWEPTKPVEIVVAALQHAGLLNAGPEAGLSHIA